MRFILCSLHFCRRTCARSGNGQGDNQVSACISVTSPKATRRRQRRQRCVQAIGINQQKAQLRKQAHHPKDPRSIAQHSLHFKSPTSNAFHFVIASALVRLRAALEKPHVSAFYLVHFCHWTYTTWLNLRSVESVVSRPVADELVLVRRTCELMLSMPAAPHGDQMMEVESASSCLR